MDNESWLTRWRDGRTAWHRDEVNAALVEHFHRVEPRSGGEVLVPLCGKSCDLDWIVARGHAVLGVELSEVAVEAWFRERDLDARRDHEGRFDVWCAGGIKILCGDFFDLDAPRLQSVQAVYDCAALVALPESTRARYAAHLRGLLPPGTRVLLLGLEYDPAEMQGPPFSVGVDEVRSLFADAAAFRDLGERPIIDIESGLAARGLTRVSERVYVIDLS